MKNSYSGTRDVRETIQAEVHNERAPMTDLSTSDLQRLATLMRIEIISMLREAGSGHPGGSLSAIDLLTVLFYKFLKRNPENALDPDRHRFVLSKGHGVPALYAILAQLTTVSPHDLRHRFGYRMAEVVPLHRHLPGDGTGGAARRRCRRAYRPGPCRTRWPTPSTRSTGSTRC